MDILMILIVVVAMTGGILLFRNHYVQWKTKNQLRLKFLLLKPLFAKLIARQAIEAAEVLETVVNPSLRHALFRMLEEFDRLELFPVEYLTRERARRATWSFGWSTPQSWRGRPMKLRLPPRCCTMLRPGWSTLFSSFSACSLYGARARVG